MDNPDEPANNSPQALLLLGARQSGLSTALSTCHHYGWSIMGNVRQDMVPALLSARPVDQCLAISLADGDQLTPERLEALLKVYPALQALLLEAPLPTLVLRAHDSDVPHPGCQQGQVSLEAALAQEQVHYKQLKPLCTFSLDTGLLSTETFRQKLAKILGVRQTSSTQPLLRLWSFGYQYGLPLETDWLLDVRFIQNPFYEPALRPFSGLDDAVQRYVLQFAEAQSFLEGILQLVINALPHYHGRDHLTVALGCTGGKHRSVTLVETIAQRIQAEHPDWPVVIHHREQPYWSLTRHSQVSG